jgi:hypothetical protein
LKRIRYPFRKFPTEKNELASLIVGASAQKIGPVQDYMPRGGLTENGDLPRLDRVRNEVNQHATDAGANAVSRSRHGHRRI